MITQPMVINAADYECHRYTVGLIADDLEPCNFIVFIRQKTKQKKRSNIQAFGEQRIVIL